MKKIYILLVACALALGGCGHAFLPLNETLNGMQGLPKEQVFTALGLPQQVHELDGMTVYVWQHSEEYEDMTYQEAFVKGNVGRTPYNTRVGGYVPKRGHRSCTISVATKDGLVVHTDVVEEDFGCMRYRKRLHK